ncbi:cyclin N-terminal domain-containing protein 1 isoform X1 [Daphnia magna]|uniref:Cyclin N-terminal domain-containing protein n=1 Tax=Daphnia magna TaxID=35525 RepID=A0ABR0AV46_9CRUS|nr:cyclin N-terminal domain-containing protein 1 isoform X1 [Daphnia magna]KAK4029007.1 hypothetical protein OUZ56_022023 [Daphnia magna]
MEKTLISLKQSNVEEKHPVSNFEAHWDSCFLDASFEEWLKYLQWYNDKARSWHETLPIDLGSLWQPVDLLTPPFVFDVAFKWCQQLKQPMGVSYRTVEIYERFARSYCCQSLHLKTTVVGSINLKTSCKMRWQEFCMEMRHQSLLHLVSCLQIASKLENGYKLVTVTDAAMLLRQSQRPCDRSTIVNSEILVLVTLKYDVSYPPISDYVDTFICQLILVLKRKPVTAKSAQLLAAVDEIHEISLEFIRAIYFDQQLIVRKIVAGLPTETQKERAMCSHRRNSRDFNQVQFDKVLLAAGAISAATFLIQENAAANVMKELYTRTGAHPADVAVVSSVLVTHLVPET